MKHIWRIDTKDCGYHGYGNQTANCERQDFFDDDWEKWELERKIYFESRKEAEDYLRPIVQRTWEYFLSDWVANLDKDEDPEDDTQLQEYKKRGLSEFRTDELSEDDPKCDGYASSYFVSTLFMVVPEHESDRIGYMFGAIRREILH